MFIVRVVFFLLAAILACPMALSSGSMIWSNKPEKILSDIILYNIAEKVEAKHEELIDQGMEQEKIEKDLEAYKSRLEHRKLLETFVEELPQTYEEYSSYFIDEETYILGTRHSYSDTELNPKKGRLLLIRESREPGALSLTFIKSIEKNKNTKIINSRLWLIEDVEKEGDYRWKCQFEEPNNFVPVDKDMLNNPDIADKLILTIANTLESYSDVKKLKKITEAAIKDQEKAKRYFEMGVNDINNIDPKRRTLEYMEAEKILIEAFHDNKLGTVDILKEDEDIFSLKIDFYSDDDNLTYFIKEQINKIIVPAPKYKASGNYFSEYYFVCKHLKELKDARITSELKAVSTLFNY